jgi:hypothetical protein
MRRRVNVLCTGVVVALALGATASAASAKTVLVLKDGGTPVAKGAAALAVISLQGCFQYDEGTVTANEAAKDTAAFEKTQSSGCFGSYTLSGSITSTQLSTKGVASYKSTLVLSNGVCAYSFKKFSTTFEANGGETNGFGEMTGKLNPAASLEKGKSCKAKGETSFTTTFTAGISDSEEELFETELK